MLVPLNFLSDSDFSEDPEMKPSWIPEFDVCFAPPL
jgi:hypothetical protein